MVLRYRDSDPKISKMSSRPSFRTSTDGSTAGTHDIVQLCPSDDRPAEISLELISTPVSCLLESNHGYRRKRFIATIHHLSHTGRIRRLTRSKHRGPPCKK